MASDPTFTVELETAIDLRDWFLDASHRDNIDSHVAEPFAELAAAIDGQLHNQRAYLEIGVSSTEFPPTHSSDLCGEGDNVSKSDELYSQVSSATSWPTQRNVADVDHTDSPDVYETLPDEAWHSSAEADDAPSVPSSPTIAGRNRRSAAPPEGDLPDIEDASAFQFITTYECTVCGGIREMETSLQVCAFVDDCGACGAVDVRFIAIEIPSPLSDSQ